MKESRKWYDLQYRPRTGDGQIDEEAKETMSDEKVLKTEVVQMKEEMIKPMDNLQTWAMLLAHAFNWILVMLLIVWVAGGSEEEGYVLTSHLDTWHYLLMTIGMMTCYVEAILSFRTWALGKAVNKAMHSIWHTLAVICMSIGLWAMWEYHNEHLYANLYSVHSWIGIITVALFYINYAMGLGYFYINKIDIKYKRAYRPMHAFIGLITFFLATASIISGFQDKQRLMRSENGYYICTYPISEPDHNPAVNFAKFPDGCKVMNGIIVLIALVTIFTSYAVMDKMR